MPRKKTVKPVARPPGATGGSPASASSSHGKPSPLVDTRVIYCGDNLVQLKKLPDASIDLIYIDPPFNSNRNYEVFWGETREKRAFEDRHASTQAYIEFMRPRCLELARVLKKTGSFYYHCDMHASHYVKVMLDQIFSENNFLNEIIWSYRRWPTKCNFFQSMHDVIFFYQNSPDKDRPFYIEYEPNSPSYVKRFKGKTQVLDPESGTRKLVIDEPSKGMPRRDVWELSILAGFSKERLGYPTQKPLALLERIIKASSNPNDIVLDAFCGCGTALVAAENLSRQWIGIDISPTACRVMAKRLRDVCHLREDENLWRAGRGFVVRDLPWTEEQLRKIPHFEFENWAVIALGGIPNKTQVGDHGIDGRIYPITSLPRTSGEAVGELAFMDAWYPIQVKQKDKVGRPEIDSFEAALQREKRTTGFFVAFDYSSDALTEIGAFFQRTGIMIRALTVKDILDEQIAKKLA
jgi:site-specific DNA-methyltransferase (adenine-specific)/adenine-specific DNA-methyltransferase